MKPYLDDIIHTSQTAFMAGRNIATNIRKAMGIIEYASNENIEAIMISIDFEKAFDRVKMTAVIGALRYFNFGEVFIS